MIKKILHASHAGPPPRGPPPGPPVMLQMQGPGSVQMQGPGSVQIQGPGSVIPRGPPPRGPPPGKKKIISVIQYFHFQVLENNDRK